MSSALVTIFRDGKEIAQTSIDSEVVVGRSEGCRIRLDDRAISREHASIRPTGDGIEVRRKSVFAPVFVNGAEVTHAILQAGDSLELGPFRLRMGGGASRQAIQEVAQNIAQPESLDVMPQTQPFDAMPSLSAQPGEGMLEIEQQESSSSEAQQEGQDVVPELSLSPPETGVVEPIVSPELPLEIPSEADSPNPHTVVTQGNADPDAATRVFGSTKVRAVLEFQEGAANVREIEIGDEEIVMGRGKTCQVILTDKKASRRHAGVQRSGAHFLLRDLGSSNGVYLNGVKIREQELTGEDDIRIGDTEFRFRANQVDYEPDLGGDLLPEYAEPPEAYPVPDVPELVALAATAGSEAMPAPAEAAWIPGVNAAPASAVDPKAKWPVVGKFFELPPRKRLLYLGVIAAGLLMLFEEEPDIAPAPSESRGVASEKGARAGSGTSKNASLKTFEALSADQKKYVESQYVLTQQLFEAKEFERTYEEVSKIFQLVPDYKDARDYERYAKEGVQRVKRDAEDRRRSEEEARIRTKVTQLEEDAERLSKAKEWDAMKVVLDDIQALDPENPKVAQWKSELADELERQRQQKETAELNSQVNARAMQQLSQGDRLQKSGRWLSAIQSYKGVSPETPDKRIYGKAQRRIKETRARIAEKSGPILEEAKARESEGSLGKAYKLYRSVLRIDPSNRPATEGMDRLRAQLSEKAKYLYAEAVMAESYSDFELANKKFKECMETAPDDNIYYERSKRKLSRFRSLNSSEGGT